MRRPRPTRFNSWSTATMMGSIPPSSPTKSNRPRSRDTGFPEPFCGNRNTTLPHPDADLSPNASISADDVSVQKVLHRSRRSFLAKHKRAISYGKILPEHKYDAMQILHDGDSAIGMHSDEGSPGHEKHDPLEAGRKSKDDGSLHRTSSSLDGDFKQRMLGVQPESPQKRHSVLRKLRIHS